MPQCTIDIPEELDKKIQHYMIDNSIVRKSEAIIKMLEEAK